MEELTDFNTLVSRVVVMELELAAVLDEFTAEPSHLPMVDLIGRGARHAFGLHSGIRIMGPSGDESELVRARVGATVFDAIMAEVNQNLERSLLRGPADSMEIAALSSLGWKLEPVLRVAEDRGAEERAQTVRLDCEGPWRHSRLRDVVSAREFTIEFQNILPRALKERNLTLSDVIRDQRAARAFACTMPSTEVSIELKTAWHRNRSKAWTANDIYDIDALALAVPYCDIVVTEKACHHVLNVARLGERMHTALLRDLGDLPRVLDEWKPNRPYSCPPIQPG